MVVCGECGRTVIEHLTCYKCPCGKVYEFCGKKLRDKLEELRIAYP